MTKVILLNVLQFVTLFIMILLFLIADRTILESLAFYISMIIYSLACYYEGREKLLIEIEDQYNLFNNEP